MQDNYKHLLMETIILLGEFQRRLAELDKLDSEPTSGDGRSKVNDTRVNDKIVSYSLDSLRLLHALDPCLGDAEIEFPQFKEFIDSCRSALIKIKSDLKIK